MPGMKKTRIPLLLSIAVFLAAPLLFSQSSPAAGVPEFDHFAVYVHDLAKSVDFYEKVMELEKIPEPFKDGRHVWFRIGAHDQLHVIGGAQSAAQPNTDTHLAFRVASLPKFMAHLDQMHVKYGDPKGDGKVKSRPDGVKQIYLQDPDGHWIEVNDAGY